MKTSKLASAVASDDLLKSASLLQQVADVGQEVLRRHQLGGTMEAGVKRDIAVHSLDAMERFQTGGYYQNVRSLLESTKGVKWWTEEEVACINLMELWVKWLLHRKMYGVELKAREVLNLAKAKGWRRTVTKAAKLLSAINTAS